jgi:hypothetical protein
MNSSYDLIIKPNNVVELEFVSGLIRLGLKEPSANPNFITTKFCIRFSGTSESIIDNVKYLDLENFLSNAFDNVIIIDSSEEGDIQGLKTITAEDRSLVYTGKLLISLLSSKLETMDGNTTVVGVKFLHIK